MKWDKADAAMIAHLVDRYPPSDIKRRVDTAAKSSRRAAGRKAEPAGNLLSVWVAVENHRRRDGLPPRPVSQACNALARDMKDRTPGDKLSADRLRRLHREAEKVRATNPEFAVISDRMLALSKYGRVVPARLR